MSSFPWQDIRGVIWDWGDTLMRDIPGQKGPMAKWPRVEAMPGAASALSALSGIPVQCVATNATDSDAEAVAGAFERIGLRAYLTRFLTSKELGARKPDPQFFRNAALQLEIPPGDLLAVGNDLEKDVLPAEAVGMRTVLVDPGRPSPSWEGGRLVVPNLTRLAELFLAGTE